MRPSTTIALAVGLLHTLHTAVSLSVVPAPRVAVSSTLPGSIPTTLLSLPFSSLSTLLGGSGRAKAVWSAISAGYDPCVGEVGDTSTLPIGAGAVREITRNFSPFPWPIVTESLAPCGTRKLLLRMDDGAEIETVLIPSVRESRTTVCVSSQVGCRMACSFCATGKMGFIRNLSSDEILAQMYHARRAARLDGMPPVSNVVFMGMGEPLNNFAAVQVALRQMTDPLMFAVGESHISVSTVGPSPQLIRRMAGLPGRIAWSVHAAEDDARLALVPTTVNKMEELRDAFADVLRERGGKEHIFVEVALIDGVNDSPTAAAALVKLLTPLPGKTRVNLIPYNDTGHPTYKRSKPEAIEEYRRILEGGGLIATIRGTRGDKEAAACGQLATQSARNRRPVPVKSA